MTPREAGIQGEIDCKAKQLGLKPFRNPKLKTRNLMDETLIIETPEHVEPAICLGHNRQSLSSLRD